MDAPLEKRRSIFSAPAGTSSASRPPVSLMARAPSGLDLASKRVMPAKTSLPSSTMTCRPLAYASTAAGMASRPTARSISQTSPACAGACAVSGPEADLPQPPVPAAKMISRRSQGRRVTQDKCDAAVKMSESFLPDQLHDAHHYPCLVADIRPQVSELRPGDVVPIAVEYTEPGEVSGVVGITAHLPLHLLADPEFLVQGEIGDVQWLAADVGEPRREGSQRERGLRRAREERRVEQDVIGRIVLRAASFPGQFIALRIAQLRALGFERGPVRERQRKSGVG